MGKNILIVILFLCLFIGTACSTRTKGDKFVTSGVMFDTEERVCLIIPEVGCGSCIAGGVVFLSENRHKFSRDQHRNKVVFTAITSMKMLRRSLNGINIDSLNCEIDSTNKYLLPEPDGLYPIALYIDNGEIKELDIQSPNNVNIYDKLYNKLNENAK